MPQFRNLLTLAGLATSYATLGAHGEPLLPFYSLKTVKIDSANQV
jgi:hypothetical protein